MKKIKSDVVVLGAGAGGFGALSALLKENKKVIVVDKNPDFGGTGVFAGVSCWEPGCSGFGVHRELASILIKNEQAGIGRFVPNINLFCFGEEDKYLLDFEYEDREKRPWVLSAIGNEAYLETEKMNPKRIVLLADAEVSGSLHLTQEEEEYKNFVKKYLTTSEED